MTPEERVAAWNKIEGCRTDPSCPHCHGKGEVKSLDEKGNERTGPCVCMLREMSLKRIRRSGLGELYERCRLDNYGTALPWQEELKARAEAYIAAPEGWFFLGGRSGSGKTHLLAAIARELLDAGMETRYFMWRADGGRLKAQVNDPAYAERMEDLVGCKLLLIDDLWKGGNVTDADVNLAYELLNARYNAPSRLTLISSELSIDDVVQTDEAVGGRIAERAKGYRLVTGDVNMRLVG